MGAIDTICVAPRFARQRRPLTRAAAQRAAVPAAHRTAKRIQRRAINQGFPETRPSTSPSTRRLTPLSGGFRQGANKINLSPEMMTALAEPLSDIGGQQWPGGVPTRARAHRAEPRTPRLASGGTRGVVRAADGQTSSASPSRLYTYRRDGKGCGGILADRLARNDLRGAVRLVAVRREGRARGAY